MKATILLLALLSGCTTPLDARRLGDGEWRAVNINGIPVAEANAPLLKLAGGQASGTGGCNSYTATFNRLPRDRIRIKAVASTRMACADAVMEQERRYLSILEAVEGYSFYSDGSLSLVAGDGRAIRLRRIA